jgi:hypothetical protein
VLYGQKLADPALMRVRLIIVEPTLRVDSTAPRMPLIRGAVRRRSHLTMSTHNEKDEWGTEAPSIMSPEWLIAIREVLEQSPGHRGALIFLRQSCARPFGVRRL